MRYIVRYLKPKEKKFNKRHLAERFMRKQYQVIAFIEKKNKTYYNLQIPIGALRKVGDVFITSGIGGV